MNMRADTFHPPIYELHVKPTYSVVIPQRHPDSYMRSRDQFLNERNLKQNRHKGELSAKAIRRLTNSVNWLVASAKNKWVYDKQSGKRFNFRINFITLTLPTLDHGISDHQFKADLLHNFINTCRYRYGLKNYVWKVETQANGNIHAHFTTDTFIHWRDIRNVWNRILSKRGIIQIYQAKHSSMTFDDYSALYDPTGAKDVEQLRRAFTQGCDSSWSDPNTTDVHAVHKVKDIAAYLAKYMTKGDDDRRKINGRLWGCSTNLSETNKLVIELCDQQDYKFLQSLEKDGIKYKAIESKPDAFGKTHHLASLFLYKINDWGTKIKGALLEKFNEHRFNIRYNINIEPPPPIPLPIPVLSIVGSTNRENFSQSTVLQQKLF